MSKRKREAVENITISQRRETSEETAESGSGIKNWWAKLSGQGKLLTVLIIGLLSLGTFGAGLKYLDEQAKDTIAQRAVATPLNPAQEGLLAKINPFVPAALPSPTPQLSKEYIYAGSRLLAVEDANATAAPPADLAIWRPSSGSWWVLNASGQGYTAQAWGVNEDDPVEGDYDGDGKTDFSVFHPADGSWQVLQSSNGAYYGFQFGLSSDTTAQADYDGDGKTDLAIFRNENGQGMWYIRRSSDAGVAIFPWGLPTDLPAPADYDGDGKADIGVWRNSNSTFYSLNSSNNLTQSISLNNLTGTKVVSGDYDGDGRADYAIYDAANWHIRYSLSGAVQTLQWGTANDLAVQNDYDGDGKVDLATWTNSDGTWHIKNSSNGSIRDQQWGMAGDIPVPAFYRR